LIKFSFEQVANAMLAAHTKRMIAAAAAGTIFTPRNCKLSV
jgi:hypothetical protein